MKITYKHLRHDGQEYLMGTTYINGYKMTGLPFPPGSDEKKARKIIKKAFLNYQRAISS